MYFRGFFFSTMLRTRKSKILLNQLDFKSIQYLPNAYAHNDSVYNFPLINALYYGFRNIEVDVHLIKNEIFVSHGYPLFPNKNKTLTKLYLQPLFKILTAQNQLISNSPLPSINLFIDVKSDANQTYKILKKQMSPLLPILSTWENGLEKKGKVQIILTGHRPMDLIQNEKQRMVLIDGRLDDLKKNIPNNLMKLISINYNKIFRKSIFRKFPSDKEFQNFRDLANQIHKQEKRIRLWNIPEKEKIWEALLANGLDMISTDKIEKLANYLRK